MAISAGLFGFAALTHLRRTPTAIRFVDVAAASGLDKVNTFGGKDTKTSILESTGTGVAIFDYDGDGAKMFHRQWTRLIARRTRRIPSCTRTTAKVTSPKWAPRRTDSHRLGAGRLRWRFRQRRPSRLTGHLLRPQHAVPQFGNGSSPMSPREAGFPSPERAGVPAAPSSITIATDTRYLHRQLHRSRSQTRPNLDLRLEGNDRLVRPAWPPHGAQHLYHNNRDGTFTDVSAIRGHPQARRPGSAWAWRLPISITMAGRISTSPAIRRPACFTATGTTAPSKKRGDAAGVAYNADGQLQAGMGVAVADFDWQRLSRTSPRRISQATGLRYTATKTANFSRTSPKARVWEEINCSVGVSLFWMWTRMVGPI